MLFDFEFLKSISEPSFVQEYNKSLQRFMTLLNDTNKTGMLTPSLRHAQIFFCRRSFPPLHRPPGKKIKYDEDDG